MLCESLGQWAPRHMSLWDMQELWGIGENAEGVVEDVNGVHTIREAGFLNKVSSARVTQIARSYGATALAVFSLECTYAGVLHPLAFSIHPLKHAPQQGIQHDRDCEGGPEWLQAYLASGVEDESRRKVHYMLATVLISIGGAGKSHLMSFFREKIIAMKAPDQYFVKPADGGAELPPVVNTMGCFSAIAMRAAAHGHIIYDPDEFGLAFAPQRGPKPSGSSASQVMSYPELLNLLTPAKGGGGFAGVKAKRTFEQPNGLMSTLQMQRFGKYLADDHSATSFRILKPMVPEEIVFKGGEDVSKDIASQMQTRKYEFIVSQLYAEADTAGAGGAAAPATDLSSSLTEDAYSMTQFSWRIIKAQLAKHAVRGDKLVPFLLKFRDIVERLGHYHMLDRCAAATEVKCIRVHKFCQTAFSVAHAHPRITSAQAALYFHTCITIESIQCAPPQVVLALRKLRADPNTALPAWDLQIKEIDMRCALNMYLCFLMQAPQCLFLRSVNVRLLSR